MLSTEKEATHQGGKKSYAMNINEQRKSINEPLVSMFVDSVDVTSKTKIVFNNKNYSNYNVPLDIFIENPVDEGGPFIMIDSDTDDLITIFLFSKQDDYKKWVKETHGVTLQ